MSKYRVLVADPIAEAGIAILKEDPSLQVDVRIGIAKDDLLKDAGMYEAIVVRSQTKIAADVLAKAEYWGTHYEQLVPLFEKDWGTVVTIADYDSAPYAKQALSGCVGKVGTVLDISLVNRPTFLAECVGQLADEVKPLLVGPNPYLGRGGF